MAATLGILMLDTTFPRISGDVGNASSYDFPVKMKTVVGATVQRVVFDADPTLTELFVASARELEAEGVAAITSSCGFLSPLQAQVAQSVGIPVFLSSLMQVPLAHSMRPGRVAILTANEHSLSDVVLRAAGIPEGMPIVVGGMQDVPAFRDPILYNGADLQVEEIEAAMLALVNRLLHTHPDIGSFVFECHNLAPYARAVQTATGKPVFDVIDFATWIHNSIEKRPFPRRQSSF